MPTDTPASPTTNRPATSRTTIRTHVSESPSSGTRTSATLPPSIDETQLSAINLNERAGFVRGAARQLTNETEELHRDITYIEWGARTAARGKEAPVDLLNELADLGFAWRDIARMIGVSVAAIQKWRRGERITGGNRRHLASLLAACDQVAENYLVSELASWFEMPLVSETPVTPADLYATNRTDLVFDYASGHTDPASVLSNFDPDWRERYRSDFEVFTAADGQRSLRRRDS